MIQNATFCSYFRRAQPSPLDFKKNADNSHPWGFTITIYTAKVQGMVPDLVIFSIDEKPGKVCQFYPVIVDEN